MRATGFPSFRFGVRTVRRLARTRRSWLRRRERSTEPTRSAIGSHRGTTSMARTALFGSWALLKGATHTTEVNFESDFFGDIGDVATFVGTVAAGAVVAGSSERASSLVSTRPTWRG